MQSYESKGSVVRLTGGGKERVTLQLISTSGSSNPQGNGQSDETSNEPSNEQ